MDRNGEVFKLQKKRFNRKPIYVAASFLLVLMISIFLKTPKNDKTPKAEIKPPEPISDFIEGILFRFLQVLPTVQH